MPPTKRSRQKQKQQQQDEHQEHACFGSRQSLSQDNIVSLQCNSRVHRYAVFDDEGNPVSIKSGVSAPSPPHPPPPPNKKEVFIPQLYGVELNSFEEHKGETIQTKPIRLPSHRSCFDEEENSLLAGGLLDDRKRRQGIHTPLPFNKTASSSSASRLSSGGIRNGDNSCEDLRNRSDASDEDWDIPDWMEYGERTDSNNELDVHGQYAMTAPGAMDRSDTWMPRIQDDDWDNSIHIIPSKQQQTNDDKAQNNKNVLSKRILEEVPEVDLESQGIETSVDVHGQYVMTAPVANRSDIGVSRIQDDDWDNSIHIIPNKQQTNDDKSRNNKNVLSKRIVEEVPEVDLESQGIETSVDVHGQYVMTAPVAMDRSDIRVSRIQDDDWDNSIPIIPSEQQTNDDKSKNNKNVLSKRILEEVPEVDLESQGIETSVDVHGQYVMTAPVAMDRSDIGVSRIQDDDWDNSIPIIPSEQQTNDDKSRNNKNVLSKRILEEALEVDLESQGMETSLTYIEGNGETRRCSLLGRGRKSQGRDPSHDRRIRRNSSGMRSDVSRNSTNRGKEEESDLGQRVDSSTQSQRQNDENASKATLDRRQLSASIKQPLRHNRKGRSRSPSRFGKKDLKGITTFSPTRSNEQSKRQDSFKTSSSSMTPTSQNAPMPHLRPAHPLNQRRPKKQGDDGMERQSCITAYRKGLDGSQRAGQQEENDDRMSFITTHRRHIDEELRNQTPSDQDGRKRFITAYRHGHSDQRSQASVSDQDDRTSFITAHGVHLDTAHRRHGDSDQHSQAVSDHDDSMSFVTAHRAHLDGVSPPPPPPRLASSSVDDDQFERLGYVGGARRSMMESPKRRSGITSTYNLFQRISSSSSEDKTKSSRNKRDNDDRHPQPVRSERSLENTHPLPREAVQETVQREVVQETVQPKIQEQSSSTEEPKGSKKAEEEVVSWEERIRLAWERIRRVFVVSTRESSTGDDKEVPEATTTPQTNKETASTKDSEKQEQGQTLPAGQQHDPSLDVAWRGHDSSLTADMSANRKVVIGQKQQNSNAMTHTATKVPANKNTELPVASTNPTMTNKQNTNPVPAGDITQNKTEQAVSTASVSPQEQTTPLPLKFFLKSPPPEKQVIFMESFSSNLSRDETAPPEELQPEKGLQGTEALETESTIREPRDQSPEVLVESLFPGVVQQSTTDVGAQQHPRTGVVDVAAQQPNVVLAGHPGLVSMNIPVDGAVQRPSKTAFVGQQPSGVAFIGTPSVSVFLCFMIFFVLPTFVCFLVLYL